jgi:predicted component of type VI protein secretion system
MKVQLRVISKNAKVKTVDLRDETLIGRGANCTLRIASSDVSREHCRICVAGSTVSIRDLGSANGQLVNGKAIAANENCELAPGSRISVGPMRFVLNFDKQADQIAEDPDEAILADQVEVWDEFGDVDDTQDDITVALDPTEDDRDTERLDDEEVIIEATAASGIDVVEDKLTDSESLEEKSVDSKTKLGNVTATEDPQIDDAVDAELESDVDSEAEEKKSDEETVFDFLEDPTPAEPVDEDELGGFLDQFDAE